jgi:hypothetical protein
MLEEALRVPSACFCNAEEARDWCREALKAVFPTAK